MLPLPEDPPTWEERVQSIGVVLIVLVVLTALMSIGGGR